MRKTFDCENMTEKEKNRFIWIDMEMTGLDTVNDTVLEIAMIVTDGGLNELAQGPVMAVRHDQSTLLAMDRWNRQHHTDSGLWQRVVSSPFDMAAVEARQIEFLEQWVEPGASPMCGNSVCQDRRFLHRLMPKLEGWFHYRNLDVSTIKVLAAQWMPAELKEFEKQNRHEALSDIRESIEELRYFRQFMGQFGGNEN